MGVLLLAATIASACNIPVFRYALERWKSDDCEAIVFYRGELTQTETQLIERLESASVNSGGTTNITVLRCDLEAKPSEELVATFNKLNAPSLPHLVIRSRTRFERVANHWSGALGTASVNNVLNSPAREELGSRLLRGDSVVWLLIKSSDEKQNQQARESLETSFKSLQTKMTLPEGIGLPGSELFSDVPLLIQFSVLEVSVDDPQESLLVQMLSRWKPEAVNEKEPLLVPVFGRGRALEVLPASDADSSLIEDLTLFLGAACSCQVKEQNPGFDLLLSVDWNQELFGDDGFEPPATSGNGNPEKRPVLLTIPSGKNNSNPEK